MWLYFNKNGQLLETLEHGNLPRAGTTDFEIFAFFEGVNVLSDYTTATLKLIKPDLNETEYPNLLMSLTEKRFSKLENENSNKFIDGNKYVGFYFAFSDFSDTQTIEVLLDTIGTWKAIITLFKNGKSLNVAGTATFTVASGIENEEGNTVSIDTLFNMCYSELSKFLPKKSDSYFKIVENASEIQIFDSSLFNVNDIIFDRTTKLYYKLKYNDDFEIILGEKIILNYSGTVEIVDNLDSDSADKTLSARQGNVLKNLINDVQTELKTELETSYRKKEEQDKIDKKKTNTYIVSCLQPEPTRDNYGKGWTLSDMDGNSFQTYDEFIEYVGDAIYSNGLLNSVKDKISLYDGRNHYLVTEDYKIILITNRIWDVLKKGDIVAVKEPNVPNRLCYSGSALYKLGSIIDETSVANKDYVDTELSALKDKVFDVISTTYEEDVATDSYSVPNDFGGHSLIESVPCEVKSIKGNSVAFNSIKTNGNFANTSGWAFENATMVVSNNVLTLTANGNNQVDLYTNNIPMVANHKYIVSFTLKNSNNGHLWINLLNGDTYAQILLIQNTIAIGTTENRYSYIFTCPQTLNARIFIYTYQKTDLSGGETSQFKNFNLHDLTLMGLDSITSVEEFNRLFPLTYYPYNAGEIKSVKVSKIESWGYNLFDGIIEGGSINSSTGEDISPTTAPNNFRAKNFIKVFGGQTYKLEVNNDLSVGGYYLQEYDANKNFIRQQTKYSNNSQFTLGNNTCYIRFHFYKSNSGWGTNPPTQEQAQVCFHLTGSLTGYKPYVGKLGTINLPNAPITLNGVNSVKDTLTFEEQENGTYNAILKRNVGVVDLGTLNWTYNSANQRFLCEGLASIISKPSGDNVKGKLLCSKYNTVEWGTNYTSSGENKSIFENTSGYISIRDTSYTDATTFKQAMSGVMLYYELATPTTEVIATGLTHEQVSMLFEIGGSIINDNENTDYNAQATTTIDFACKDWSI